MMILLSSLLLSFVSSAAAQSHDGDLMSFVTLPDIRAVKWDITWHDRDRASPGYWFVAPMGDSSPQSFETKRFHQYQIGPYIYDEDGILIWAGSYLFENRNIFDFKPLHNIGEEPRLSFIEQRDASGSTRGQGIILSQNYTFERAVEALVDLEEFNVREFNVLPGGHFALACVDKDEQIPLHELGRPDEDSFFITGGFYEVDTETGDIAFKWRSDGPEHVNLLESIKLDVNSPAAGRPGYDYVHINSVDKNEDGNYLISLQYTDTIYLISGRDGSIMWRFGGHGGDFLVDFKFSKQHDAKFVKSNGTHHTITLLNNAADEYENEEEVSSVLLVELDTTVSPMKATLLRRLERPDGGLSRIQGNAQYLDNGNIFVGWGDEGYHTEFAPNGDKLVEARFASSRFSTYRAYKSTFVGRPTEPPDVVATVMGVDSDSLITTIYVSWNGATEVDSWNFYAQGWKKQDPILIGNAKKVDFETLFIAAGYMDWISAEALDRNGNVLGKSEVQRTEKVPQWETAGFRESSEPTAEDPALRYSEGGTGRERHDHSEMVEDLLRIVALIKGIGGFFIFVLVTGAIGASSAGIYWAVKKRRERKSYKHVPAENGDKEEIFEIPEFEQYHSEEYQSRDSRE
ncbi:hypothetical protein N7510_010935 [Penicillium lagena]|uniref:uncharacterized protein n=1 Tax=Penicillium lagena TaxID=94218 RepID=UPI0025422884|nr:uncharacterized protein N7510_010935 [Penicillium lagena]KAJ5601401.1 hypothetical protein N7510_010935 [Penicillium lagena]